MVAVEIKSKAAGGDATQILLPFLRVHGTKAGKGMLAFGWSYLGTLLPWFYLVIVHYVQFVGLSS